MKNIFNWLFFALICIGFSLIAYDMMSFQMKTTKNYTTKLAHIQELANAVKIYRMSPLDVEDFADKIITESTIQQDEFQYSYKLK